MLIHCVFFWLKPECNAAQQQEFLQAVQGLLQIPDIGQGWVGPPAATRDEVIDHSYALGLTLVFADQAAHDRYQIHSLHQKFVEKYNPWFSKVQVYDMLHLPLPQ